MQLFPPNGGTLSPYLVGSFDLRNSQNTIIQLINPTAEPHRACVALFDDVGKGIPPCTRVSIPPNGMVEVNIRALEPRAKFGVVKVVSLKAEGGDEPENGLIGYQRQFFGKTFTETILQPVPAEVLKDDLKRILSVCKG